MLPAATPRKTRNRPVFSGHLEWLRARWRRVPASREKLAFVPLIG
jgi:hypothetical protein